jgi:hypothetical protein
MSYTIKKYNGQVLTLIKDGSLDTESTPLQLPGRNYSGYGFSLNQSLTYLLENFANNIEPLNKITGQLWFDTSVKKIKVFNGATFKTLGHLETGNASPNNQILGDLWFNTATNQLFVYDGSQNKLIGPPLNNPNAAQLVNRRLLDDGGNLRTILEAVFDNTTIAIFSKDEFNIDSAQTPVEGYSKVAKGITLPSRNQFPNMLFSGVAKTSESLLVNDQEIPSIRFVQNVGQSQNINTDIKIKVEPVVTQGNITDYRGLFLGSGDDLYLGFNNGTSYISNVSGSEIAFSVTSNNSTGKILYIDNVSLAPFSNGTIDLGTTTNRWRDVYANKFFAQSSDPNDTSSAFIGRVIGTTVSATGGFVGNIVGNIRGNVLNNQGTDAVLNTSGSIARFFGDTIGSHEGNIINNNSPLQNRVAVNVSGSTTIFTGEFRGNADSALTLKVGDNNRTAFVGTGPSDTEAQLRNTVVVRDSQGNIIAKRFVGISDVCERILDEAIPGVSYFASVNVVPNTVVVRGSDGSINVGSIQGTASNSARLTGLLPSIPAIPGTIPERDSAADLYANIFHGRATSANYADLAEKYLADKEYDIGTVVMIGGDKEITASKWGKRAIGAVSDKPAYLMNSGLEDGTVVALKGRIPVKVIGSIKKGDELIAADDGYAVMAVPHASGVFAISLETNSDTGVKLVECLIL